MKKIQEFFKTTEGYWVKVIVLIVMGALILITSVVVYASKQPTPEAPAPGPTEIVASPVPTTTATMIFPTITPTVAAGGLLQIIDNNGVPPTANMKIVPTNCGETTFTVNGSKLTIESGPSSYEWNPDRQALKDSNSDGWTYTNWGFLLGLINGNWQVACQ